jgi:hypothetical protein
MESHRRTTQREESKTHTTLRGVLEWIIHTSRKTDLKNELCPFRYEKFFATISQPIRTLTTSSFSIRSILDSTHSWD